MPIALLMQVHTYEPSPAAKATEADYHRASEGDTSALERIWRAHNPELLRYLRGLAVSLADDVASQVWMEAARSIARFEGGANDFRRWLFTIARRRMIDAYRKQSRSLEEVSASPLDKIREGAADESADRLEWAESVLRQLPPNQAEVVLLRVVAGLPVDEVATMTGRSPGAVRVMAHRGLQRVLEILATEEPVAIPSAARVTPEPNRAM